MPLSLVVVLAAILPATVPAALVVRGRSCRPCTIQELSTQPNRTFYTVSLPNELLQKAQGGSLPASLVPDAGAGDGVTAAPNLVVNAGMDDGRRGWTDFCPDVGYSGHSDVTGEECSKLGPWGGATINNNLASGTVWHLKSRCYAGNRGGIYQDFPTIPDSFYEVQFATIDGWFASKVDRNVSGTLHMEVQSPVGAAVLDESHETRAGAAQGDPLQGLWEQVGPFEFKAHSNISRIYFYAGGSACPSLDNVHVSLKSLPADFLDPTRLADAAASMAPAAETPGHFQQAAQGGGYHPMVAGRLERRITNVVQPWQNRGVSAEDDKNEQQEREFARRQCCKQLKEEERARQSTTTLPPYPTTVPQMVGCCDRIHFEAGSLAANASGLYVIDPSLAAFGTVYRLQGDGLLNGSSPVIVFDVSSAKWLLTSQLPHCGAIYGVSNAGGMDRQSCPAEAKWDYVWNHGVDRNVSIRCAPVPTPAPPRPTFPPAPGLEWDAGGIHYFFIQHAGLQQSGFLAARSARSPLDLEDALCLTAGKEDKFDGVSLYWHTCQEVFIGDMMVDPETGRVSSRPYHVLDPHTREAQAFAFTWTGNIVSKSTGLCIRRSACSDERFGYDLGPCDGPGHVAVWEANKPAAGDIQRLEPMGTPAHAVTYDMCEVCGPYQLLERCLRQGFAGGGGPDGCSGDGQYPSGWTRWPSHYLPPLKPDDASTVLERLVPDLGMAQSDMAGLGKTDKDGICGTYATDGPSLNSFFYLKAILPDDAE